MKSPNRKTPKVRRATPLRLLICTPFFDPFWGGLAWSVKTLAGNLFSRYNFQITVVTLDTEGTGRYQEEIEGMRVFRLPCVNVAKLWGEYYALPKLGPLLSLLGLLSQQKFDAVSTQTRFFVLTWIGFFFGKIKKIPVVHTERGSSFIREGNLFVRWIAYFIDQTLGRMVLSLSDRVVGVSETSTKFARRLGAKKPLVIYNGIDLSFWRQPLNKAKVYSKYGWDRKNLVVCFVGRVIKAKGIFDLLEAVKELNRPDLDLVIVGDGPNLSTLKGLTKKLSLRRRVTFTGALSREGVREVLKVADVFVNPSYTEGLPTSVMEAVAAQTYVIASDVGGTREILCDARLGKLFQPGDVEVLKTLIEETTVQRPKVDKVPECFVRKFDWNLIARTYYDLFQQEVEK